VGTSACRTGSTSPTGGAWTPAKRRASQFAAGAGSSAASVVSGYATALRDSGVVADGTSKFSGSTLGGGRLRAAVKAGQGLGAFLSEVASKGLDGALHERGFDHLIGRTGEEVLAALADHIAGNGGPLNDAIARAATVEVLAEIFDEENPDYDTLRNAWEETLKGDGFREMLLLFLSKSIFEMLLADMADRFEANGDSASEILSKEREIEQFILHMIDFELGEIDPFHFDWAGFEGKQLIERNFAAALEQLEILEE
jgi:hypothetical protein